MYCYNCGNEIRDDASFCPFCGRSAVSAEQKITDVQYGEPYDVSEPEVPKRRRQPEDNNKSVILWVCITVLVLIICVFASVIIVNVVNRNDKDVKPTAEPTPPIVTHNIQETNTETFVRTVLYNPSYVYETMNDIHSSSSAEDGEALELKQVIHDFNSAWIEFINYYDKGVYDFLRAGTNPYKHARDYEAKSLYQKYELMDVMDVRKSDSYYYVWVHEIINETDYDKNKQSVLEYHWVYRIGKDADGYYVHDYIRDPAFKK